MENFVVRSTKLKVIYLKGFPLKVFKLLFVDTLDKSIENFA